MSTFITEIEDETLILIPQTSISSLARGDVGTELAEVLEQIRRQRVRHVVIDLGKVDYFGSLMLAMMHALYKSVCTNGGTVVLCNVSDVGREVLHASRFDTLWTICPSRSDALHWVEQGTRG